ncbi:hypothetical protein O1611_g9153 [Lasiodiplodia mahajangana]|uniref:Uncharacterized protein n=1 Tax=Lasiodiplodia mahajangana TaxID=1108764 RepID=A0ACC2JAS4_9PEZI|nr:hypothetical protein O1611_g9153 [Lasiodiplodia mahajangana]
MREQEEREKPPCCSPFGEHEMFCPLLGSKPEKSFETQKPPTPPSSDSGISNMSSLSSLSGGQTYSWALQQRVTKTNLPGDRSSALSSAPLSPAVEAELLRLIPTRKATRPPPIPDGTMAWNAYKKRRFL